MGSHSFKRRRNKHEDAPKIGHYLLAILILPLLLLLSLPSSAMDVEGASYQQLASTVNAEAVVGSKVQLEDFVAKAQAAIDFMRPGGQLEGPHTVSIAQWSPNIADQFAAHLQELYRDDLDTLGSHWIAQTLNDWQASGGQVARLSWGVLLDGVSHPFDSVAVFDSADNLLFDTALIRTVTSTEVRPATQQKSRQIASVAATDSETVKGNYKVSNFFGSVNLSYEVNLKAEVAPYITAATNDAAMTMTASVKTARGSTTGLAPIANPQVYFGTGGKFHAINTSAAKTPFKSKISVSDAFQDGSYKVSGNDLDSGINFDLSFGVSVSGKGVGGSVGISIPGPGPLILVGSNSSASELFLGNVLYCDNACLRYRGAFRDGGNFKLSNFLIRTGDGTGETGSVSASIPVYMAHEGVGVLELTGKPAGTLSPRASYVRGDHIKQPTYTVTTDRETVEIGEDVTVTVQVKNNSSAVDIRDVSVVLDAGTLNGSLILKSAATVNIDKVSTQGSQEATFVLTAVSAGQVTVQADVDGRWGSPVPPEVKFAKKTSLEDPIEVVGGEDEGPGDEECESGAEECREENGSKAQLESPQQGSFESGIGLIRGWVCDAEVIEIQIDGRERRRVGYGTNRVDTREVCNDINNGFGFTVNWNNYGDGSHTLRMFVDGEEATRVDFNVTTLGTDYLRDASGEYTLMDFPETGQDINVRWSEPHQNFVIMDASIPQFNALPSDQLLDIELHADGFAQLESPREGSYESGIGLIRGWVCDADFVEIQIDDRVPQLVAYGTNRADTEEVCGDADNGFGLTVNWNNYGDGPHTLRMLVDGVEYTRADFTVTTLGEDFMRGASGEYTLDDFPETGDAVTVEWSQPHQNFVITNYR